MQAGIQSYVDDVEILPLPVGTPAADAQDYSFAGWSLQEQAEPVGSLSYLRAGSEFAVAQPEQTLYAVYRYFATPAGTTPAFHELTEAPEDWSGTYVLSAEGHALLCDGSVTGAALGSSEAAVLFADAGLAEEDGALRGVSAAVVVQIERAAGTEQYAIRLGGTSDAVYLACRSNSEQLNTAEDTGTSLSRWVISMEDGHMTIRSARYLSRTLQYVADHVCDKLSVEIVSREVGVSASHLTALFHRQMNISPGEYIRRVKLEESKRLIREGTMNFSQIAAQLNYSTIHHFSRQFKDKFGMSPSEYAKSIQSRSGVLRALLALRTMPMAPSAAAKDS